MARTHCLRSISRRLATVALLVLGMCAGAHAGTVTLAWDANSETDLAGYIVSWGTQPGTYTASQDVRNVITHNVTGLAEGQRYYFAVQAYNTSGLVSPYSDEVNAQIPGGADAPTVTSVTPGAGPASGGTAITVTGTRFVNGAVVTVGGVAATAVAVLNATTLTALTPAHAAGTVSVAVTLPSGASGFLASAFTYAAAGPVLTSVTPPSGKEDGGSLVTIRGYGFEPGAQVTLGGAAASNVVVLDGATITLTTPAHAPGPVAVTVANSDGQQATKDGGFTYVSGEPTSDLDGDGLPDVWENRYGLDPNDATGDNGATGDPDGDGAQNRDEMTAKTHPRGLFRRYFAEGVSSTFFTTVIAAVNPNDADTTVVMQFFKPDGSVATYEAMVGGHSRTTLDARSLPQIAASAFSTVIESDVLVVADRTVSWDATGYGGHAETAIEAPSTRWYFAEGATHSGFDLFYLLQNPNATEASVEVRYLLPAGDPVVKTYAVPANSRYNIWVDLEDPRLAGVDVSAVVTSTNDVPVIAERSMYKVTNGQPFGAGHNSAGVTAPSKTWFLAEGATGEYFDSFVLIANPNSATANVRATYLLPGGVTVQKTYDVAANSRFNVWVDYEDAKLANTAVSTTLECTNDVPIIVERTMWWPGFGLGGWLEAHNAFGTTATSSRWAVAEGEQGGPQGRSTYILLANTSATAATVKVTLMFEDGSSAAREFQVAARSRFNVDISAYFPAAGGARFGALVESLGSVPAQIVVERAMYWDAGGVFWAAGTDAVATALPAAGAPTPAAATAPEPEE